ncbi:MAG: hypothetical protein N2558_04565 [Patescibacteria group bacterium]|nr:hypothetical protein [Patescibacteria group bacterium]
MPNNSSLFIDLGQGLLMSIGLLSIPSWSIKKRPKKAKKGTFGFNLDTKSLEYWDGKNWYTAQMNLSP